MIGNVTPPVLVPLSASSNKRDAHLVSSSPPPMSGHFGGSTQMVSCGGTSKRLRTTVSSRRDVAYFWIGQSDCLSEQLLNVLGLPISWSTSRVLTDCPRFADVVQSCSHHMPNRYPSYTLLFLVCTACPPSAHRVCVPCAHFVSTPSVRPVAFVCTQLAHRVPNPQKKLLPSCGHRPSPMLSTHCFAFLCFLLAHCVPTACSALCPPWLYILLMPSCMPSVCLCPVMPSCVPRFIDTACPSVCPPCGQLYALHLPSCMSALCPAVCPQ